MYLKTIEVILIHRLSFSVHFIQLSPSYSLFLYREYSITPPIVMRRGKSHSYALSVEE